MEALFNSSASSQAPDGFEFEEGSEAWGQVSASHYSYSSEPELTFFYVIPGLFTSSDFVQTQDELAVELGAWHELAEEAWGLIDNWPA